jgi:hypothetical protein
MNFFLDLVVVRYKEPLDWINEGIYKNVSRYFIYNKGDPILNVFEDNIFIYNVNNTGRDCYTYLDHIIKHYDNLADITMFVNGCGDCKHKGSYVNYILSETLRTRDSVIMGQYDPHIDTFYLDNWKATSTYNIDDDGILKPADIRPFGEWRKHNWPDLDLKKATYLSIFSIHKRHILQHDPMYYTNLILQIDNTHRNPEICHYFERAWISVFYPINFIQR